MTPTETTETPALQTHNLTKTYGHHPGLLNADSARFPKLTVCFPLLSSRARNVARIVRPD